MGVLLFSGHMIDAKSRPSPRFPPDKEDVARAAIGGALDQLGIGATELGIAGAACGGDILFAEAMLARGARLDLHLPMDETAFLAESVTFEKPATAAGDHWAERFVAVTRHDGVRVLVMPDVLGPTPAGENPHARCNLWMLDDAFAVGESTVRLVCLWDGGGGDGPGGTRHMLDEVRRRGGEVVVLDTKKLWSVAGTA